ncbi:MAG TPA: hypothetical protein VNS88_15855 [Nitrospiraceae bacterium]|nr:hypothetical protein [Nitrospiraceae bacterium]
MVDQNPNTTPDRGKGIEPPPKEVFNPFMDEGIVDENNMDTKGRDGWHRPPIVDYPEETEMVSASVRSWSHNASQKRAKERDIEEAHAARTHEAGANVNAKGEALQRLLAPSTGPLPGEEQKDNESDLDFKARIHRERDKKRLQAHKDYHASQHQTPPQPSHTGPEHERRIPEHGPATGPQPTQMPAGTKR